MWRGSGNGEHTAVKDQNILTLLNQVGGDKVPAEGTRARNDEGLGVGLGGEEELTELGQGLAESGDKGSANVRLTRGGHGIEDGIVELNGARDEEGGVSGLRGHSCGC